MPDMITSHLEACFIQLGEVMRGSKTDILLNATSRRLFSHYSDFCNFTITRKKVRTAQYKLTIQKILSYISQLFFSPQNKKNKGKCSNF